MADADSRVTTPTRPFTDLVGPVILDRGGGGLDDGRLLEQLRDLLLAGVDRDAVLGRRDGGGEEGAQDGDLEVDNVSHMP